MNKNIITLEKVRSAKKSIILLLKKYDWFRGAGITKDATGIYCVQVCINVLNHDIQDIVPLEFDGVAVLISEIGDVKAQ